jgi:hypothetical protein
VERTYFALSGGEKRYATRSEKEESRRREGPGGRGVGRELNRCNGRAVAGERKLLSNNNKARRVKEM